MKHATIDMASPLRWPQGKQRTPPRKRKPAKFKLSLVDARDDLLAELRRLGARYVVLSSDLEVRKDGLPYASQRAPTDTGVAVYFNLDKEQYVFACDRWDLVEDNVRAIGKTIEALRGIRRWGSGDMLRQAFRGFKQLAPASDWRSVFGLSDVEHTIAVSTVRILHRKMALKAHPDRGGTNEAMANLNAALAAAEEELGG